MYAVPQAWVDCHGCRGQEKLGAAIDAAVGGDETDSAKLKRVQSIVSDIEERKLLTCAEDAWCGMRRARTGSTTRCAPGAPSLCE